MAKAEVLDIDDPEPYPDVRIDALKRAAKAGKGERADHNLLLKALQTLASHTLTAGTAATAERAELGQRVADLEAQVAALSARLDALAPDVPTP